MHDGDVALSKHFIITQPNCGDGGGYLSILLVALFDADQIMRMQTPTPPLLHRTGRYITDNTQFAAGEITSEWNEPRRYEKPQKRRLEFEAWSGVAPIAGACCDSNDMINERMI